MEQQAKDVRKIMIWIWAEFSAQAAKNLVEGIAPFRRLQASPGCRAATAFCRDRL